MTLKNNRAPLLCYSKLCASFHSHWWIQSEVTVRKPSIWVKIGDFLSHVTLKFDGWPWKTIGHLFYVISSFVHHFIAFGEFEVELQSGNAKFRSNLAIFVSCDVENWRMTFKNNRVPLYATSSFFLNSNWSYSPETPTLEQIRFDFNDLELWPLTSIFSMDITFFNGNSTLW